METYVHAAGSDFKSLPEVYQVELTNACNLKCPMCLRTTDMVRPDQLLDVELLRVMNRRGDFAGSYYVELQMAGEPTLHPRLHDAVRILRDEVGVLTGLSTHGLMIGKKRGVLEALLDLDALTVSVDSVDPKVYHRMRYPAHLDQLRAALKVLFLALADRRTRGEKVPFVELQLVEVPKLEPTSGNVEALEEWVARNGWSELCHVRTTSNCFDEMQGNVAPGTHLRNARLCVNPFASVSVAQNGDVVSCCYVFEPDRATLNWYGNLHEQSLAEVWHGQHAREMRAAHAEGASPDQCAKCYLRSPVMIHMNILSRLVRLNRRGR